MSKTLNQIKEYARQKGLPLIPIKPSDISLIDAPSAFYSQILERARNVKRRIVLSALYLGTGTKEETLVNAIHDKLDQNKNLTVSIVLDANRATRVETSGKSSLTVIDKLMPFKNAALNLIGTNTTKTYLGRFLQRYQKWNEITSTYHAKFLVFDDDVMVTGANLSDSYFLNRQDRYMSIRNSKTLSKYIVDLLDSISQQQKPAREAIYNLNRKYISQQSDSSNLDSSYVIPLAQHGPSGLTELEDFLRFISATVSNDSLIYLSSGYFNPSESIDSLKIKSVLAPSEAANGFYRGRGLLKYVPRLYTALHKQYLERHKETELCLYNKPGWSFHAKGVWIRGNNDFYIHLIGSSNFNCRSSDRDFETQLAILTTDRDLIERLERERLSLWSESKKDGRNVPTPNPLYTLLSKVLKTFL